MLHAGIREASEKCQSRTRIAVRDGVGEHDGDNAQLHQLWRVIDAGNRMALVRSNIPSTRAAGSPQPDELADGLLLLMDGAFASTRMYGRQPNPGGNVATVARTLIVAHTSRSPRRRQ